MRSLFSLIHFNTPFSEAADTIFQVTSGFESRVGDCDDIDVGQSVADQCSQVLWECAKSIIAALEIFRSAARHKKSAYAKAIDTWLIGSHLEAVDEDKK